jgi:nicotinamidase-related amidase
MEPLRLAGPQTALVAIDLQHGIVEREWAPYSGADVVLRHVPLADAVRGAGGLVVWVRVDLADLLRLPMDAPAPSPADSPPPRASELVPEIGMQAGDVVVTKRQWGAFYGTDLDQQLRRRGIRTIVMSGIATNFGVESTARGAFDRGYELVFAEDAMTSATPQGHAFSVHHLFTRMGRVRKAAQVIGALTT